MCVEPSAFVWPQCESGNIFRWIYQLRPDIFGLTYTAISRMYQDIYSQFCLPLRVTLFELLELGGQQPATNK